MIPSSWRHGLACVRNDQGSLPLRSCPHCMMALLVVKHHHHDYYYCYYYHNRDNNKELAGSPLPPHFSVWNNAMAVLQPSGARLFQDGHAVGLVCGAQECGGSGVALANQLRWREPHQPLKVHPSGNELACCETSLQHVPKHGTAAELGETFPKHGPEPN